MSLEVWLEKGKKVNIGGRDLVMMPLPLSRLFSISGWLEDNCKEVVKEALEDIDPKKPIIPMALVMKVLLRVDVAELAFNIFSYAKNPDSGEPINAGLKKEFFADFLDIPTAHNLFKLFIEINQLEELIKNLQSLPVVKKLMEAASLTFGTPFLSSLQPNTDSPQSELEGSHSPKSIGSSEHVSSEKQESGRTSPKNQQSQVM